MKNPGNAQTGILIELLAKTSTHDKSAFARLYRLTSPKLFAISLRILKHDQQAEDCLQDAYISIWNQAISYKPDRSAPMTWMSTIVRNRAIDQLRKQKRDAYSSESEIVLEGVATDNSFNPEHISLWPCLDELKPEQKQCIMRAYLEGLTHKELAEEMSTPVGTIKTWIRRGLHQLRECLEK